MLLQKLKKLLINFFVSHEVGEAFDAGAQQTLCILQLEHMGDGPEIMFMRFVDRRSIKVGRQLHLSVVSIVNPDFDEVGTVRRQIAHGLSGLLDGKLYPLFNPRQQSWRRHFRW